MTDFNNSDRVDDSVADSEDRNHANNTADSDDEQAKDMDVEIGDRSENDGRNDEQIEDMDIEVEQASEDEFSEPFGHADHFHEDRYVHGVAAGLQAKYDLSDMVYSYLVYSLEVPVTEDGEVAEDNDEAVAVLAIMEPVMPGGIPMPMEVPMLDGEDPYTVDTDAEDLDMMDIVAYYDEDQESTVTGLVIGIDEEAGEATVAVGNGDEQEEVTVETGGNTTQVEINGESMAGGFEMANDDDAHEQDWWRIEEFEEALEESSSDS